MGDAVQKGDSPERLALVASDQVYDKSQHLCLSHSNLTHVSVENASVVLGPVGGPEGGLRCNEQPEYFMGGEQCGLRETQNKERE